ncbi:MAG: hypothetical protein V3U38_02705 [Gemmatimonadota bacterium]|nr:hypothetical protein [Candidatus Palauibacterales bacterium]
MPCRSCHELYAASELDRYLFCPPCRQQIRRRGASWGRIVGLAASVGVAAYVVVAAQPSRPYLFLYALALALTYVLASRIASSLVQGYYRAKAGSRQ